MSCMIEILKKTISDESLQRKDKIEPGSWINMIDPTEDQISNILEKTRLDEDFIRSALDLDEKPRVDIEDKDVLVLIQIPYVEEGKKLVTLPLSIIITSKTTITVCAKESIILKEFYTHKDKNFYTTKKTRFALQILRKANKQYQYHLSRIEAKIENIEQGVKGEFSNNQIIQLLELQKSLVYINTAIISNDKVLEKILNGKVLKLFDEDEDLLEDIIIDNKQSIDMVKIYTNILNNTMNAYSSLISNNVNNVMKFLTSVTVILAIPTIVASIYGMNVALPLQNHPHAFGITMLITLMLSLIWIQIFIKKRLF